MASGRLVNRDFVCSAKFLKMPLKYRFLYFELLVWGDDDGAVEAFSVLNLLCMKEKDLKYLEDIGYVVILNDDLVTYPIMRLKYSIGRGAV